MVFPAGPDDSSRARRLAASLVCLAAALPYLPTLGDYFVNDDFGVVQLLSGKPWSHFPRWFVTSWMEDIWGYLPDEVRPFPALSYQLASKLAPTWPVANHALNIAFHAANGLLVLALARGAAGLGLFASTFAALVFVLLPVHAESVAWITGRVDTFPTFFYVASFLFYVRWRTSAGAAPRLYAGSLVLFFVALFSKQNTITMVTTLVLYDVIVAGRGIGLTWRWVRPYVPYVMMTLAYLALRYVLFGEVARERSLNASGIDLAGQFVARHLRHVVFGSVRGGSQAAWAAIVVAAAAACWWAWRSPRRPGPGPASVFLYFGPIWWLIGVAPIAVAGYESPRHVYLAAMGWAVLVGLACDLAWRARSGRAWRLAVSAAAALVLFAYVGLLQRAVHRWQRASALSEQMVRDVEREALASAPGTLMVIGGPSSSWEWALPFAARPPYTSTDLTARVLLVTPMRLHCCRHLWADHTRASIATWNAQAPSRPVVALGWDAETGARFRVSDREYPDLRTIVLALPGTGSPDALDQAMLRLMTHVVRGFPAGGRE